MFVLKKKQYLYIIVASVIVALICYGNSLFLKTHSEYMSIIDKQQVNNTYQITTKGERSGKTFKFKVSETLYDELELEEIKGICYAYDVLRGTFRIKYLY